MKFKNHENSSYPIFPAMGQSATYRIEVLGRLDSSWSARLAGMEIITTGGEGVVTRTTLPRQVMDQSALMGILNTLCGLGFPLLSAVYLSGENSNNLKEQLK